MESLCPKELIDQLPEALTKALTAAPFKIDAVVDEYLRAIHNGKSTAARDAWSEAERHAYVITNLLLVQPHYKLAIEQLLKGRIRDRIRTVHG